MPERSDQCAMLGIGLYSVPDVARILKVSSRAARRWVDGYFFRKRKVVRHREPQQDALIELVGQGITTPAPEVHYSAPVIETELPDIYKTRILTFADMVELLFVVRFRQAGVPMSVILDSADYLADLWQTDHPFALERFDTDGRVIFGTMVVRDAMTKDFPNRFIQVLHEKQLVFDDMVVPYFRTLDFQDDQAHRYWPLGKGGRVVLDRDRSFGKPIDAQTGVRTLTLYRAVKSGEDTDAICSWYDVSPEAIEKAVQYETSLRAA